MQHTAQMGQLIKFGCRWKIKLKWIIMKGFGLDLSDSGQRCEHSNEPLDSIKAANFLTG
jgi:hypothetical protein